MKIFTALAMAAIATATILPATAKADETVKQKLETYKEGFVQKAPQDKQDDYEEGIRMVRESGVLERAKNVGDTAPDFTLQNAAGQRVNLSDTLAEGPVVLIWYRGEWCPYCNIYLEDIQENVDKFEEAGAKVIAISPAKPDQSWSAEEKEGLKFHVLSDEGSAVAEEYGVVYTLPPKIAEYYQKAFNLSAVNGDDRNLLPLSASYVIGQDGVISYAYLNADYRERAETSVLIEEVKKLGE